MRDRLGTDEGRRVLCVDDHPLFRAGLCGAWRRWRPQDDVFEAGSVESAHRHAFDGVDVAVVDLVLPDGSGLTLARQLWDRYAPLLVLLSSFDSPAVVEACRRVGVRAFFSKELPVPSMFAAMERMFESSDATSFPVVGSLPFLTPRQLDVLSFLIEGRTNPSIAESLGVSIETVKTHVREVLGAFEVHDRFAVAEKARRLGYHFALPHLRDDVTIDTVNNRV